MTGPRQIVIGRRAAESLKKGMDDTVRLYGVPYRIVGIYETGQGDGGIGRDVVLEDAQNHRPEDAQGQPLSSGPAQGDRSRPGHAPHRVAGQRPLREQIASEYDASEQWTQYLQGFAWGIAAIAILIGGLGMMNAMVMSVLERTREIGTLRAVGWSRRRVVTLILGESVVLSLLGGLVGIALGVGLTELAAAAPGIGAMMEGAYSPGIFMQGMVTALCLGVFGGAYPAWRAANLQPVEALRYEGGGSGEVKGRLAAASAIRASATCGGAAPAPSLGHRHRHRRGHAGDDGRHDRRDHGPAQQAGRQQRHRQHHRHAAGRRGHEHEQPRRADGHADPPCPRSNRSAPSCWALSSAAICRSS